MAKNRKQGALVKNGMTYTYTDLQKALRKVNRKFGPDGYLKPHLAEQYAATVAQSKSKETGRKARGGRRVPSR